MIDDRVLEQTVRDALHDAADYAQLATGLPLTAEPARVTVRKSRRPLLAAAAIVIGLAVVVTLLATRDGDDGVRVTPAGGRVLTPDQLPRERADLEVFLTVKSTPDEAAGVQAAIDASPDVAQYAFVDHDAQYHEFRTAFASCNPDLVQSVTAADLPMSFRVLATTPDAIPALHAQLRALPGVEDVTTVDHAQLHQDQCSNVTHGTTHPGDITVVTLPPVVLPTAGVQPPDPTAARDAVVAAFRQAWNGSSTPAQRQLAMEDGDELASALGLASANYPGWVPTMSAVVGDVTFEAPDRAAVVFHLAFAGHGAQADYVGHAVLEDGAWKVSRDTVCVELTYVGVACPS